MGIKLCEHVKENGSFCQSPALRGRDYCYFHLRIRGRRMAMAQARAQGQNWSLNLPPLEDMYAVQAALMQVLDALAADRIDPRRAALMLSGLRQAASNLKSINAWTGKSKFHIDPDMEEADEEDFQQRVVAGYPDLEREFSLPKRVNLDLPPEHVFPPPPPPQPAEPTRTAVAKSTARNQGFKRPPRTAGDNQTEPALASQETEPASLKKKPQAVYAGGSSKTGKTEAAS